MADALFAVQAGGGIDAATARALLREGLIEWVSGRWVLTRAGLAHVAELARVRRR